MKILHISDTHNKHHEISTMPEADVLVHTGDLSEYGTEEEVHWNGWFLCLTGTKSSLQETMTFAYTMPKTSKACLTMSISFTMEAW